MVAANLLSSPRKRQLRNWLHLRDGWLCAPSLFLQRASSPIHIYLLADYLLQTNYRFKR